MKGFLLSSKTAFCQDLFGARNLCVLVFNFGTQNLSRCFRVVVLKIDGFQLLFIQFVFFQNQNIKQVREIQKSHKLSFNPVFYYKEFNIIYMQQNQDQNQIYIFQQYDDNFDAYRPKELETVSVKIGNRTSKLEQKQQIATSTQNTKITTGDHFKYKYQEEQQQEEQDIQKNEEQIMSPTFTLNSTAKFKMNQSMVSLPPKYSTDLFIKINNLESFLKTPLQKGVVLSCIIKKQNNGAFNLNPKYSVYLKTEGKFIMNSKRLAARLSSQYIISTNKKNITTRDKGYLAKIKASFFGTDWTILQQENLPQNNPQYSRKQAGYIRYETNIFGLKGPRKMDAVIPLLNTNSKSKNLISKFNETGLKSDLQTQSKHIIRLQNKLPTLDPHRKIFTLDFKGKVKEPSVKNFILLDKSNEKDCLIFGKQQQNTFLMELKFPLSPVQAFAFCLSSLDRKYLVQ